MEENNKFKLTKLDLFELIQLLSGIYYGQGADYIDIIGIPVPEEQCDTIMIITKDEYMAEDNESDYEQDSDESDELLSKLQTPAKLSKLTQEDLDALI